MYKLFLKISDFVLCFLGTVFILTAFAGMVTFGSPSGKHSPYPLPHYVPSHSVGGK